MPIVYSDTIPDSARMREWWYNSLDAAVTHEIDRKLSLSNAGQEIYAFERAMQGPALDMMLRGFKIDPLWRSINNQRLSSYEDKLQDKLDRLSHAVWGKTLNPRSPDQLKDFFYNELHIPEVWISQKGIKKLSVNREALEKISDYYLARPFVNLILGARNTRKQLGVLRTGVGADGRMRCTYNVCGTETGRWASSISVWGDGTNLQNITDELRRMFVADDGYILVYVDGEQAESRAVGFIQGLTFGDWTYLDACEEGDLHTTVSKLVWSDFDWTGDPKLDRAIADQVFYRWFTYRDMAKRGGHGTNYYGTPWTMAKHLKVPQKLIESFQQRYCMAPDCAFPAFKKWWTNISVQLGRSQSLTTFLGRERTFYGRPGDDATLREAIAYEPQSTVGDIVNEGGRRVWKEHPEAQVLAQIHDAYLFQIPESRLDLIDPMCHTFQVTVPGKSGRDLLIPAEAKIGWNWASNDPKRNTFSDGNPDGLIKWNSQRGDSRSRVASSETSLLDRVIR